jgi:hypothetical protein
VRLTRRGRVTALASGVACLGILVGLLMTSLPTSWPRSAGSSTSTPEGTPEATPADRDRQPQESAIPSPASGLTPSRGWQVAPERQALAGQVAGYARPHVRPGEPIELRVSTTAPAFTVTVYRIGDYGGKGSGRVGRWGPFPGSVAPAATSNPVTGAIEADWPVAATLGTEGWEPGLHLIALWTTGDTPKRATVPIVVTSPSAEGRVLLVAGDTTWQAYNQWGGVNAYQAADGRKESRSRAVSFARPYAWSGYRWPAAFDIPLVRVAEASGVPLAYASVSSLTSNPGAVTGARGIVSNGHDEYWTPEYRDAILRARDSGTSLAFLGANTGYWRTEMRDDGWTAWMPKEGLDARWRDDPEAVAENAVTGQLYDCYPARADMVIEDPDFFLFQDTGVSQGTRLTNLVGNESDRFYPLPSAPRPIQVPAVSPVDCNGNRTWSTITYYTTDSGAGVFTVGTMNWVRAMGGPRGDQGLGNDSLQFTRTVTTTLLRAMAEGAMGRAHPARDDYDVVDLPATITSGAVAGTPNNPELP